jgi:hypothetical protein
MVTSAYDGRKLCYVVKRLARDHMPEMREIGYGNGVFVILAYSNLALNK